MEGYLNKYINMVYRYKPRYFSLKNGILSYSDSKGHPIKGLIHLKISEIDLTPEDPLKIILNSGTRTLELRANTIGEKIKWLNALRASKEEIQKKDCEYNKLKSNFNVETLKNFFEKYEENPGKEFENKKNYNDIGQLLTVKINEIWAEQMKFDEVLKSLSQKLGPNSSVSEVLTLLEKIGTSLLKLMSSLTRLLEDEKKNLDKMIRKIDHKLDKMEGVRMNVNDGKSLLLIQEELKNEGFSEDFGSPHLKDSQYKLSMSSEEIINYEQTIKDMKRRGSKALTSIKEEDSPMRIKSRENDIKIGISEINERNEKSKKKQNSDKNYENEKNHGNYDETYDAKNNIEKFNENSHKKNNEKSNENPIENFNLNYNENFIENKKEDSNKLKDLQLALSRSLNKIKVEDPFTSKIENTVFESFDKSLSKDIEDTAQFTNIILENNIKEDASSSSSASHMEEIIEETSPVALLKNIDPVKRRLLSENEGFKNMILNTEPVRNSLPKLVEVGRDTKAWEQLRSSLGKDISKFVVPIELHEPLSILQRLCEPYAQADLLERTESLDSSSLRLAYVMAFAFSAHASSLLRVKKPFDSLLGETFEFTDKKFKYFSEQVSVSPSIIATFCESPVFKSWSNMNLKSSFYGKYIEYRPIGVSHIILHKNQDHFIWTKPVMNVENILNGTVFVENYGDMNFTNLQTHETGVISLNKSDPNHESGRYNASGYIKNSKGKIMYNLNGRLDKFLKIIEIETQKQTIIWEYKKEFELLSQNQYYFDQMTLQLNYLNSDLLRKIPNTDSRFRPDIRALEYLDYKVCLNEKKRLEEKEKKLKKEMEENNEAWKPKWFVTEIDEVTKLKSFVYLEKGNTLIMDKDHYIDIF